MSNGNDPPPSYSSLFQELNAKKEGSDGFVSYSKEVTEVISKKATNGVGFVICGICCSLINLALPIAEIVIGSMNLKECPAQKFIPIYLIVAGVFGALSGFGGVGQKMTNRKKPEDDVEREDDSGKSQKHFGRLTSLTTTFLLAWLICGSVWTFRMEKCESSALSVNTTSVTGCFTTDEDFSEQDFYCKKLVYDFTFINIIIKWAVYALFAFIGLIVCCCCCVVFCCKCSGKKENENENGVEMKS
ncbi:hypothetical protein EB796_007881 [Bugula neritina]|uniref:Transmembrane protein n=1 Tax=Bugula neritina TaxID=10212 RepID=A0A7J7K593_BUGNE|nr:hypothetical protein EB796_007881 [Bugula neritina]